MTDGAEICERCGRTLRPYGAHVADAPDTVARASKGLCQSCKRGPAVGRWKGTGPDPSLVRWRTRYEEERRRRGISPNGEPMEGEHPHDD